MKTVLCMTAFFAGSLFPASGGSGCVIWDDRPAGDDWAGGRYPIGNGRLGAMLDGGVMHDRIQFNVDSLWTGDANVTGAAGEADSERTYAGMGAYQNFGELHVEFLSPEREVRGYRRSLDLASAVHTVSFSRGGRSHVRMAFASVPDDVIGIRYVSQERLSGRVRLQDAHRPDAAGTTSVSGCLANGMGYAARAVVVADGRRMRDGSFREATNVVVWLKAATSFDPSKAGFGLDGAIPALDDAVPGDFGLAMERAAADHRTFFGRVSLELGKRDDSLSALPARLRVSRCRDGETDPGLQALMFQFGRYLLLSSSRPGTLPANLQGLWNDSNTPKWACDYHTDVNIQMNYWPADVANVSETWQALSDYLLNGMPVARADTRKAFPCTRGFAYRTSMNFCGGQGWRWNFAGAPWLAAMMFDHFRFTRDREFLRGKAYPFMKGAAEFMLTRLRKRPDGTLVVRDGWSPEHGPREDGVAHDQQILRELLLAVVEAQRALGDDGEFSRRCAEVLRGLAPDRIGRWGQLQEWQEDRDVKGDDHRHTSHLYAVYPGSTISRSRTPELAAAAAVALDGRALTGDSRRSWTWPWRAAVWARLGEPEKAADMLNGLLAHNTLGNLLCNHPPMQLDGNFGLTAAVAEMLVQSHETTPGGKVLIRLLPALPGIWAEYGFASGLKARGGYVVSLVWRDGKIEKYGISGGDPSGYELETEVK